MRILVITPQPAWPPRHGAAIRNSHLIAALAGAHEVDTVSLVTSPTVEGDAISGVQRSNSVQVRGGGGLSRIANLLVGGTPDLLFRYSPHEVRAAVVKYIMDGHYDVVQIEGLQLAWIIPDVLAVFSGSRGRPRIVYDAHNVEWRLQCDLAITEHGWRAIHSRRQSRLLRIAEHDVVSSADLSLASTHDDASALRQLDDSAAIEVLPHPVHVPKRFPGRRGLAENPTVLLAANFGYRPNARGSAWLFGSVWPAVLRAIPEAILRITGPGSDGLRPIAPARSSFGGIVSDIAREYTRSWIAVSPVEVGGGAPYKVLQAYAAGRAVVVRGSGLAGIAEAGSGGLVTADSEGLFAGAVVDLLRDREWRRDLGTAGYAYVRAVHDAEMIGQRIAEIYDAHQAIRGSGLSQ